MAYNLIITNEMETLLDDRIGYLLRVFKNEQAATHLMNGIEEIYGQLEINPYIYSESQDDFMKALHYHEAKIPQMNYILIYKIVENEKTVFILGIYNTRENYFEIMKFENFDEY